MNLSAPEIILIVLAIFLLFGAKRLPESARSLGKSMRIFKAETRALHDDDETVASPAPRPVPPRELAGERVAQPVTPVTDPAPVTEVRVVTEPQREPGSPER